MVKNIIFTFLFLLIFICFGNTTKENIPKQTVECKTEEEKLLDSLICFTKKVEGLELHRYNCPAGYITIGYGHVLKENEHFTVIDSLQADSLLREDIKHRFNYIKSITGNTLKYNKVLALSHFIFNVKIKHFFNLVPLINNSYHLPELLKYNKFYKDSVLIESSNLTKQREFEYWMWNLKM